MDLDKEEAGEKLRMRSLCQLLWEVPAAFSLTASQQQPVLTAPRNDLLG